MSLKKKILIIPSWYPSTENPGLGTFFREQAALFADEFDIRIMAGRLERNTSRTEKLKNTLRFALLKKTNAKELRDYFLAPPQVYGFTYSRGMNKYAQANFRLTVKAYGDYFAQHILPNWKPDLIHAQDTFTAGIIARHISRKYHIPYIITEHNYLLFDHSPHVVKEFTKAMQQAGQLLVVSEYQKRILQYRNIRDDIHVVGNYINEKLYSINPPKVDHKSFYILFVGRYAHHKDYPTLAKTITIFSHLLKNKYFKFQIIGTGNKGKTFLKDHIPPDVFNQYCEVFSYVNRNEIPEFFKSADVLLSTSIAETFGVVTGEAMMCGKPVVSTNSGGFDEMYVPGVNGIKCAIGDAEGLARALLSMYNKEIEFDPVEIRKSVLNKFGSEAFKAKMKPFYEA